MRQSEGLRELYEARRLDEAWREYRRLLDAKAADAESHLLGALTVRYQPSPDFREARRALERAEAMAPVGVVLGKVRFAMGTLLREIGDTTAAIEYLEGFVGGIGEYPELRAICLGPAYYNLGLTYRCARRYQDALRAYTIACQECRENDFPEYLLQTLQNLAWLHCCMGNVQLAETALLEAEDLCRTEHARWHQRIGWAYLEAVSGERTSALNRCESIIKAEESAPPAVVSHAYWVAGHVALMLGQLEHARMMADQAIIWSLKVKDDVRPMQDANSLRRDIHETRVHKDQAGA